MRDLFLSLILTLVLAVGWRFIFRRSFSTGLGLSAGSYLALIILYWLDHVSLYFLIPITLCSLFLGLLMAFKGLRYMLFHSREEKQVVKTAEKVKNAAKPKGKYTEDDFIAEFQRRGFELNAKTEPKLDEMTLSELFKNAEKNGIHIGANK